ncbi:MAG: hypothetical protein ABI114_10175 [Rhodanobacter sp.]
MKALLMHPAQAFDLKRTLPSHEPVLRQDLELDVLWSAMADDDAYLFDVARRATLGGLHTHVATVLYRQDVLRDSLEHPDVIRHLYELAVRAIDGKQKSHWSFYGKYPSSTLHGAIDVMTLFVAILRRLREVADTQFNVFRSRGFTALFGMLREEFGDDYLATIDSWLDELKFGHGVLLSANLGAGNVGTNYTLRHANDNAPGLLQRVLHKGPPAYTFRIPERDIAGAQALGAIHDRGINLVANALAQSMDHIFGFFETLRAELAFYVGALNLDTKLHALGVPTVMPQPTEAGDGTHHAEGLRDPCLALSMGHAVVGNTLAADHKSLLVVTGANQGGKSSFLRSFGVAQLMLQSGLYVAADSFAAELCHGLFTHYKREEDKTMTSGKLDEELGRISIIADAITPNALLLLNESFASTNELEGAEIARQIVAALQERAVRICFVTHLFAFAHDLFEQGSVDTLFLRAQRREDGTRTFRLVEGEPLETSYGADLYREVFEGEVASPVLEKAVDDDTLTAL